MIPMLQGHNEETKDYCDPISARFFPPDYQSPVSVYESTRHPQDQTLVCRYRPHYRGPYSEPSFSQKASSVSANLELKVMTATRRTSDDWVRIHSPANLPSQQQRYMSQHAEAFPTLQCARTTKTLEGSH